MSSCVAPTRSYRKSHSTKTDTVWLADTICMEISGGQVIKKAIRIPYVPKKIKRRSRRSDYKIPAWMKAFISAFGTIVADQILKKI